MPNVQTEIDAILAEAETALATLAGPDHIGPSQPASAPSKNSGSIERGDAAPRTTLHLQRVLAIEVPVIVRLAERSMPVKSIMQLATGSIIEFEKAADDELDLMINNKCIGHGQAVKVGENFGLRVSRIESVKEKIDALAGT
jgi:flagellar motor switch protein FliN